MTAPSAALRNAINEAEYLLKFVAERKGTPTPETVEAVEVARAAIETGSIDGRQETAFWSAFSQLSRRAAPATVDSLRYVANMSDRKTPMARALRWLRRYTIFTFIILTGLQIYWTMLSSLVGDVTRMNDEINGIVQNVRYAGEPDEKKRGASDLGIRFELLQKRAWSVYETMYCVSPIYVGVPCWWWRGSEQRLNEIAGLYVGAVTPQMTAAETVNEARNFIEQTARLMLQVISIYFLPLLYGTLGAGVYVLRRFTFHLDRLTFTEATHRRYRIRLMLGGIFGLAIGVMCTSEQTNTLFGAYSPFFLSFLAGYSVEGVFAALDSAIISLRDRLQPGAPTPVAATGTPATPPRPGGTTGKNGNGTTLVHPAVARGRVANGARGEAAE